MRKRLRLKKMVSALLAVAMIGQSCLVTTAGDLTDDAAIVAMQEQAAAEEAAARKAAEEKAAQEAAAAQKAAEEKAAQEAAAAQKAAEEKAAQEAAAAQKAAEEAAAAQKAAEEAAAAQKAAEEAAAAQKAAEEKAAQEAAAAQKAAEEAAAQKAAEEAAAQKAAEEAAAQEAAAAQKAAEDAAAQKAAEEAAVQKAAEEAAAQKAAEDAAAQKAAEEAAVQKAAEEAAAQKAAEEAAAQKAAEDAAAQKAAEDAAAQKAAEEKAAQEITYRVTFEAHATDYGSIYVRGESGPIASVSNYYKEVKENGSFAFTIHTNDGYEVEHVRYADTNAELPKNAQGAYEIAAVTRNVKVVVTYKLVPQETADAVVETEADEGQTEAPTGEPETEEDREAETEVGTEHAAEESTEAESEYETEPGTEAESETESESEKEILMPEFHYNGVCNGIAVAIRAPEGVFPEGTKAVLAAPSAESLAAAAAASGQDASDLMGVDITFRYDGKEIQPTSAVEVSFRAAEIADADISNVYHVSDGGAVQEVAASKSGASLGFTADSFSTWIFPTAGGAVAPASILDPETSIATYIFKADGAIVDTQYITSGDTLSEPAAPVKEGYRFIGWYVGETPVIFGTVSTVSKTEEIIVEARFEEVYYVFFHNPGGAVVATKEGIAGAKITTSDVTFAVGAEESITGWYEASDYSGSAVESVTLSDSNRDLYAKVENGFWVTYDSDGGSYVAPEFYPAGETAALSAQPTKNGYSFEGWYDGDARVNSTTMSVSVKAKWKENSRADYRVIYWQQKVTDDKNATDAQKTYAYVATETKTGKPGTTVNASSITKSYNGFTKNTVNSKSVTIAADGSTIMNVYYDRVLCTVNYHVWKQRGWSGEWNIARAVTGLYGANLKEGEWWTEYYWYTHKNGGNGCILLTSYDFKTAGYANNAGNISSDGVVTTCNFYGTGKETGGTVYYYNEQADGSFKLVNTVTTGGGTLTIHQKYAGYDLYKYTTGKISGKPTTEEFWKDKKSCKDGDSTDRKTVHIASKLQSFRLDYSNGGEVQHHETIKYTASLNGYDAKFTPTTRPATVDANYTFDGWYSDPECTKKFDFNTTMPVTNIVVYAGWKAPEVRVTAHRSPEDTTGVNIEAAYGESVDEHLLPTISYDAETQEFLGWFTRNADGSYRPWDFSTKIYSDVDLYARVISKGTFKVSYDANGGIGTVEDSRAYAQGAKADVKAITGIIAPAGKTFLYWSINAEGSGKKYYPNNTIEIEKDITLYAIWGDTTTTSLTYDGNGGATSDGKTDVVVSGLKNNQKVKAEGTIFTRTGYKFVGWSTKSDATAAEYAAGADVIVHADETVNVLYAVWEIRNDYQYTVHYYWNSTTEKAAEDKVVPNQTYNETITESPITIKGYTPVNSGSQKMVIDTENKTLTFYYYKNVGLTANSDTKVYNGQEQSVSGFTGAPEGADFSAIQVGAKGTDAGEYLAAFAEGTIGTVDKTEKYIVKGATDGKLTIKPVADEVVVTIEGNHDSKVYDGTEHVVTGYEVTEISNVLYTKDNFSFSGNAEAKRTAVGKTDMGLTAANFKNESANFSNVTFAVTDGYMEITPAGDAVVVTIVGNNASAVYDGTEHKVTGYTVVSISNKLYK
ncbi:MAG: InlB B-repeat-containing protein, partial [Lachnospiraceae bacterium]|nr:InlB B-repeat-containing protein [Lachnospiraceae bacterium]